MGEGVKNGGKKRGRGRRLGAGGEEEEGKHNSPFTSTREL